jgi:hypothetical protein
MWRAETNLFDACLQDCFDFIINLHLDTSDASTTSESAFVTVSIWLGRTGSQRFQLRIAQYMVWPADLYVPNRGLGWGKHCQIFEDLPRVRDECKLTDAVDGVKLFAVSMAATSSCNSTTPSHMCPGVVNRLLDVSHSR